MLKNLMAAIEKELSPLSIETLRKLCNVYQVSEQELAALKADFKEITDGDSLPMQTREFATILYRGLPEKPESGLEQAPA